MAENYIDRIEVDGVERPFRDTSGSVRYDAAQNLTDAQKKQAISNIGAATSDHNHSGKVIQPTSIELLPGASAGHGGYIDFHYNNDSADYTSRFLETSSGRVTLNGKSIYTGGSLIAMRNVNVTFTNGIGTYTNSNITKSSVTFVQWRAGAVSTLQDSVLSTTANNGSLTIVAKNALTGGPLPVNILIINKD